MSNKSFNFAELLLTSGEQWASNTCYIDDCGETSYGTFIHRTRSFAQSLIDSGAGPDTKILLVLEDSADLAACIVAGLLVGATTIPCNPNSARRAMREYLSICQPHMVIASAATIKHQENIDPGIWTGIQLVTEESDFAAMFNNQQLLSTPNSNSLSTAFMLFTSGGSGKIKAVVHDHASVLAVATNMGQKTWHFGQSDIVYNTSKLSFGYGLNYNLMCSLMAGATAILRRKMPTHPTVLDIVNQHRPTIFASVPGIYNALLAGDADLSCFRARLCISGGEMLPQYLPTKWHDKTGTEILETYGLTEINCAALVNRPDHTKRGSVGTEVSGIECEIRDELGNVCAPGAIGQLYVKSPSIGKGYYNNPPATDKTFQDQWIATGDRFTQDHQGFFNFIGRINDMFKVNAQWVSPVEIERALVDHAMILEAGVTSITDNKGLTKVGAFVVADPATDLPTNFQRQLQKFISNKLEHFKIPHKIFVVDQLPKNANGKLQRSLLTNP